jgi:hypothetical protein
MNKLNVGHPSLSYPDASPSDFSALQLGTEIISVHAGLESAGRLLVLVPAEIDRSLATKRLWEVAVATGRNVQLIGLCKDSAQEPSLRRDLVTMSALMSDGRVSAEAKVEIGTSWIEVAKRNLQPGDMIVCFAEQRAGLTHKPLSQILQSNLNAPVYILSGLSPQPPSPILWRSQVMAWLGSISILVGAFILQIRIVSMPEDWIQTTLMILSVIAEIWLIGAWNSLLG